MGFNRQPARHVIEASRIGTPRNVVTIHPLCDGPISLNAARTERASKVAAMAAILLRDNSYADERDAMRSLFGKFSYFEITVLMDDARQVATQHAVAMVMGEP